MWPHWLGGIGSLSGAASSVERSYTVNEEIDVDILIANIVNDAKIGATYSDEEQRSLRYKFLTAPTIPIRLNEITGELFTSGRIDRETICGGGRVSAVSGGVGGGGDVCRVRQDVAVHPIQYFQVVKVFLTFFTFSVSFISTIVFFRLNIF